MLPLISKKLNLLTLIVLLGLLFPTSIFAAEFKFESSDFTLKSSPAGRISEVVLITNLSDTRETISLSWQGYQLEDGNYLKGTSLAKHSIDFATISPNTLTLNPQATGTINVIFQVPEKTGPGDYYGSLIAKSDAFEKRVGFTLTVLGKLNEKVEILSSNSDGRKLSISIVNQGNVTVPFSAEVNLHNLFGTNHLLKSEETIIRAGEIKTISLSHPKLGAGLWQQEILIKYGSKNTPYTTLDSFWISPLLFFVPFALILTALTFVFLFTWKKQ